MEFWIVLAIIAAPVLFYFERKSEKARREREEKDRQDREAEEARQRRADAIDRSRKETEDLVKRGSIFEITTTSDIRGYHVKELGWVRCECDDRSMAENELRSLAAGNYRTANALTKLSSSLRDERYEAGTGPRGNPYYRNRKIKTWEVMACEAIPNQAVDKSPIRWNYRSAIVDGSNVAHWGNNGFVNLGAVKEIVLFLRKEGSLPFIVFDANIGFKAADRHMDVEELVGALGGNVDIEVVPSGTVADRRIVELAEQRKATIVSNDLFRDSRRARVIPKRRGFFLPEYNYVELLDPRA